MSDVGEDFRTELSVYVGNEDGNRLTDSKQGLTPTRIPIPPYNNN